MANRRTDPPAEPDPVITDPPSAEPDDQPDGLDPIGGVTTETTAALYGHPPAGPVPARKSRVVISEGVRTDLLARGEVTDPATGLLLKRDPETGAVTATHRGTGKVTDLGITVD